MQLELQFSQFHIIYVFLHLAGLSAKKHHNAQSPGSSHVETAN